MPKRKSTSSSSNSSKKSTPTSLNEQLQADGYRIIHVPRLGNCLFAAIETQFQGYTIAALRARAVEYMREHPNEFATLAGDGDTFTAYLARMSRDRTWGGDAEAQALASSLLINIHIYDNNGPTRVMVPHNGIATRDIRILHDHYHFDAIVPTNFKSLNNYYNYNSSSVIDLEVPQENPLPEKKYITSGFKELENDLKELEASGYKMRWVEGDGNCLFRSVAEQLKGFNQNDHGILRKKTATYLKDHREDFSGQHRHTDIEEAISYVSKLTNYAGNFEFQILADYLGVDIQVHEKYGYFIASRTKTITKTDTIDIHVYFFGLHFWAVLRPGFEPIDVDAIIARDIGTDNIVATSNIIYLIEQIENNTTPNLTGTQHHTGTDITALNQPDDYNIWGQQNNQLTGISMIMIGVLLLLEGYSH